MNSSLLVRSTAVPLETVCARLPDCATKHKFGMLGVHNLKEKIQGKGLSFDRECRVFEVCSPQQAKQILEGNIAVSAALPCRISVYVEAGRTVLASIEPAALLGLFGPAPAGADQIAGEVRQALVGIMDDAARA